jgi:hypothetical protein
LYVVPECGLADSRSEEQKAKIEHQAGTASNEFFVDNKTLISVNFGAAV